MATVLTFPQNPLAAAQFAAPVLLEHFELEDLSMGGGTVLQARWRHRASHDVDLFCRSAAFSRAYMRSGAQIERAMVDRAGSDPERTWMEHLALYCEIDGVETTLMPHTPIFEEPSGEVLPGDVPIPLQTTSEILANKLRHRLHGARTVEVRDLYDLAFAVHADPDGLEEAKTSLAPQQCAEVAALIAHLPKGWSRRTDKPLFRQTKEWTESEMVEAVVDALVESSPDRDLRPGP